MPMTSRKTKAASPRKDSVMGAEVYEAFKAMGAQMKKQARLDRP